MKAKKYAKVNRQVCVACGSCEPVCPKQAMHVVRGCYADADKELCIGCGKCTKICPVGCIETVEREVR